jgi:DNA-binding GntR family transcriptional regulator
MKDSKMTNDNANPARKVVYDRIRDDILAFRFNEGEKLIETELAKKYDVSRTPIREALLLLEQDGYVSIHKNKGAVVRKFSAVKVKEIFETIAIIEGRATEKLDSDNISAVDLEYLNRLQKKMEMAAKIKKFQDYMDLNLQFHQFIVARLGNESLRQIDYDLRKRVYRIVYRGLSVPLYINNYLDDHRRIIAAIEQRDFLQAGMHMEAHVMSVANNLYQTMI